MTSREIILANLARDHPPRPGLTFDRGRANDFFRAGIGDPIGYTPKRWTEGKFEYYDDKWGNIWRRMIDGCKGGEVVEPALKDFSRLDDLKAPQWDLEALTASIRGQFADDPVSKEKFRCVGLPGWVFADARYLRKMEVYFMDMAMYPEELHRLHQKIAGVYEGLIRAVGQGGADGFFFCEDMGTQNGLLFSPKMWREYFGELYAHLFGVAHEYGLKVLMHSCGKNFEIVPDLLEAGVDCFQLDQPALYDMPALAKLFREHRAALWSPVDIQKIMPTGDRNKIEAGAREMFDIFQGGLLYKNYPDLPGIGVAEEWDDWAYEEILRLSGLA
ncbi:MAG: hypothetical protein JXA11_08245 [Phycisphaerae bacterium]|nr:hypothetical protein [Phycisphaerae bacterium]